MYVFGVTYNNYITNIYMLLENSVLHMKCASNIYISFQKLNDM